MKMLKYLITIKPNFDRMKLLYIRLALLQRKGIRSERHRGFFIIFILYGNETIFYLLLSNEPIEQFL